MLHELVWMSVGVGITLEQMICLDLLLKNYYNKDTFIIMSQCFLKNNPLKKGKYL